MSNTLMTLRMPNTCLRIVQHLLRIPGANSRSPRMESVAECEAKPTELEAKTAELRTEVEGYAPRIRDATRARDTPALRTLIAERDARAEQHKDARKAQGDDREDRKMQCQ